MSELIKSEKRRARKDHQCGWCLNTIETGTLYLAETYKYEGELSNGNTCLVCDILRTAFKDRLCDPHGENAEGIFDEMCQEYNCSHPVELLHLLVEPICGHINYADKTYREREMIKARRERQKTETPTRCHADREGECCHPNCPVDITNQLTCTLPWAWDDPDQVEC